MRCPEDAADELKLGGVFGAADVGAERNDEEGEDGEGGRCCPRQVATLHFFCLAR